MRIRRAFVIALVLTSLPAALQAIEHSTYSGKFRDHDSMFTMPKPDCSAGSWWTQAQSYHTQKILVAAPILETETLEPFQPHWGLIVRLYGPAGFDPSSPGSHCIPVSGSTGDPDAPVYDLEPGWYTMVVAKHSHSLDYSTHFQLLIQTYQYPVLFGSCAQWGGFDRACLLDRFLVLIDNVSNKPYNPAGNRVHFSTSDTAIFWFYGPMNFEVVVKVLNGCPINGHYWVFIGALTDQAYTVEVRDTTRKIGRTYSNTEGTRAPAIADTTAFPCS